MDWSLVRGKTQVKAQVNAAVKTTRPQNVFTTCCDSEDGTVWDVSVNEAKRVTL